MQCLQELGYAVVPIKGTSMWPLLQEDKSLVQLTVQGLDLLKKGDLVLYQRQDGTLVLHRIMQVTAKHTFRVCGDHQWKLEEEIKQKQILAVAQGCFCDGRYVDFHSWRYGLYHLLWNHNLTVRRCCLALLRWSGAEQMGMKDRKEGRKRKKKERTLETMED